MTNVRKIPFCSNLNGDNNCLISIPNRYAAYDGLIL